MKLKIRTQKLFAFFLWDEIYDFKRKKIVQQADSIKWGIVSKKKTHHSSAIKHLTLYRRGRNQSHTLYPSTFFSFR